MSDPLNHYRKVDGYVSSLGEAIVVVLEANDADDATVVSVSISRGEHDEESVYFVDVESVVNPPLEMV